MALADHNADAANELARKREEKHRREMAEASILLEAGSRTIAKLMEEKSAIEKEKEVMALLLEAHRTGSAQIVYALDCSTQLVEALLAWLPEGMALSDRVSSAHGAWTEAMKKVVR